MKFIRWLFGAGEFYDEPDQFGEHNQPPIILLGYLLFFLVPLILALCS